VPVKISDAITENCHIGLSGSSVTAKEVNKTADLVKFSIYCGRETREKTIFNEKLPLNSLINVNEAAAVVKFSP